MDHQLWRKPFLMIMIINFLIFLSFNMLNPIFPLWLAEEGMSSTAIGIFSGVFTLGSIILRPVAGNILDTFGRRRIFLVSMALLVVCIQLYTVVPLLAAALLLRLAHGFDWGIFSTGASTLATDVIPRRSIGRGMGYFGMSMALSLALAPVLAISLYNAHGFVRTVSISAAICALAFGAAMLYPYPPEVRHRFAGARDVLEPTAVAPAVMMGCVTLTMSAITTFVPLYARTDLGLDNVGPYFTVYAVGLLITRPLLGILIDRIGMLWALLPSFALLTGGLLLLSGARDMGLLLVSGFLYGAGYGGAQTSLQTLAVMHAPHERHGAANGTFFIGFDLGIVIGAVLAGVLSGAAGYGTMFLSMTGFILAAFVIALIGRRH